MADRPPETLVVSDWLEPEVSSAFAIKCRMGVLSQHQREQGLAAFARLASRTLTVVRIEQPHFRAAARLVDNSLDGLRAGDALHLAVALDHATTLCTLDKRFGRAALSVGIKLEGFEDGESGA